MRRLFWIALIGTLLTPATARAQDVVVYYHADAIGSVRAMTDETGAVIHRYDFLPFGEAWDPPPNSDTRQFAGKERDRETGLELDYFGARYHLPVIGRFTTVDPVLPIEDALLDPQRWNRYSYVMNRPITVTDPDGRCGKCVQLLSTFGEQASKIASRYGTAAYNWATRFFNTPTGQEVTATATEVITGGQLPMGFSSGGQFQSFAKTLQTGLAAVGGDSARAFLTGSAVSGANYLTGAAFDVGRKSDFDIALVGGNLLGKAKELGLELRGQGNRTGPLRPEDLRALGLEGLAQNLSQMAGRPVNFMIYGSEEALRLRGGDYLKF